MTKQELVRLLALEDFTPVYEEADRIRRETVGDEVHIRAIIEFSNICSRHCKYCGLNCTNEKVELYQMTKEEILATAREAIEAGYKTIVLQSGENPDLDREWMGSIVKEINRMGATVTLSIGELSDDDIWYYRDCGADRYLLKHETADPEIYSSLHPCGTLESRTHCLITIREAGYETGSGFMIGLPGQTLETIAEDLLLLKNLGCKMAGIGPFIPHPETPLKDAVPGDPELTKRAVALARILIPDANLPVTTALGVINQNAKDNAFSCGANVVMKKVTPDEYKEAYEIYPAKLDKTNIKEVIEEFITELRNEDLLEACHLLKEYMLFTLSLMRK